MPYPAHNGCFIHRMPPPLGHSQIESVQTAKHAGVQGARRLVLRRSLLREAPLLSGVWWLQCAREKLDSKVGLCSLLAFMFMLIHLPAFSRELLYAEACAEMNNPQP